jgi:hypothetical protein
VCADCVSYKHNKHNFEPIEKIIPEKLNELEGAPNKFDISLTVSFPGIKYLISEGIRLKFKSDIIFLDFVAVVRF